MIYNIFFSKIMSGMEHRLTDSNLIISRSDLNALKNVLVDKIHEKSTLIVQSMMVSINFGPDITKYTFYVNTNTTLNICLDFFISFSFVISPDLSFLSPLISSINTAKHIWLPLQTIMYFFNLNHMRLQCFFILFLCFWVPLFIMTM